MHRTDARHPPSSYPYPSVPLPFSPKLPFPFFWSSTNPSHTIFNLLTYLSTFQPTYRPCIRHNSIPRLSTAGQEHFKCFTALSLLYNISFSCGFHSSPRLRSISTWAFPRFPPTRLSSFVSTAHIAHMACACASLLLLTSPSFVTLTCWV